MIEEFEFWEKYDDEENKNLLKDYPEYQSGINNHWRSEWI